MKVKNDTTIKGFLTRIRLFTFRVNIILNIVRQFKRIMLTKRITVRMFKTRKGIGIYTFFTTILTVERINI